MRRSTSRRGIVSPPGRPQQEGEDHDLRNGKDEEQSKIVGGEVSGSEGISHMPDRDPDEEQNNVTDDCALECQAAPERHDCHDANCHVRDADLELERTDLPADGLRRDRYLLVYEEKLRDW